MQLAALPFADAPVFMAELRARESIARALEFLILTTMPTGEVIEASRGESDLKKKEWTIPAGRMKGKKQHRVPLSDRAVEILQAMPSRSRYTFAKKNGEPLSNMAMLELLRGMRPDTDLTVHGFNRLSASGRRKGRTTRTTSSRCSLIIKSPTRLKLRTGVASYAKRKNMMKRWAAFLVTPSEANPRAGKAASKKPRGKVIRFPTANLATARGRR